MTLKSEEVGWFDASGMVSPEFGHTDDKWSSGNGIRYSSERLIALESAGEAEGVDFDSFLTLMENCERQPGLMMRGPTGIHIHGDQQSFDDYIALFSALRTIIDSPNSGIKHKTRSRDLMMRIYAHGLKTGFVYNNVDPGKFTVHSWLGRFQFFRPTLEYALGFGVPWWRQAGFYFSILTHSTTDDGWIMTWHQIHASGVDNWITQRFEREIMSQGGAAEFVFRGHKEHPVRAWFPFALPKPRTF